MRQLVLIALLMPALALAGDIERAPSFSLPARDSGVVEFDSGHHPRPVLVLFWATWCPFCARLMPELQIVRDRYSADELDVFAIHVFDDEGDPDAHLQRLGYTFTLARQGDEVAAAYGVKGTPGLFLIDLDGHVVYTRPNGAKPVEVREALVQAMENIAQ